MAVTSGTDTRNFCSVMIATISSVFSENAIRSFFSTIPQAHLPKLFDRFYRVDPSRQRKGEGSGIGLAIVKSIVTAHHGKVRVESDAVSTRFILTVPGKVL